MPDEVLGINIFRNLARTSAREQPIRLTPAKGVLQINKTE